MIKFYSFCMATKVGIVSRHGVTIEAHVVETNLIRAS